MRCLEVEAGTQQELGQDLIIGDGRWSEYIIYTMECNNETYYFI